MDSFSTSVLDFVKKSLLPRHPSRYFHTLLVRDIALSLQEHYSSVPVESLALASVSHDMCKYLPLIEVQALAKQYQESFPEDLLAFPQCVHGFSATLLLQHQFHVTEASILRAVRFHTTGTPDLDILGLILYVADFLASLFTRKEAKDFPSLYTLCCSNIHAAALQINQMTLRYLTQTKEAIHPLSLEFSLWLENFKTSIN